MPVIRSARRLTLECVHCHRSRSSCLSSPFEGWLHVRDSREARRAPRRASPALRPCCGMRGRPGNHRLPPHVTTGRAQGQPHAGCGWSQPKGTHSPCLFVTRFSPGWRLSPSSAGSVPQGHSPQARPPRRAGRRASTCSTGHFGTHHHPNFVLDVYRQAAKVGQPIILFRTTNATRRRTSPPSCPGHLSDFYAAGLVSAAVALHYGCTAGPGHPGSGRSDRLRRRPGGRPGVRDRVRAARRGQRPVHRPGVDRRVASGSMSPCSRAACPARRCGSWTRTTRRPRSATGYLPLINGSRHELLATRSC